MMLSNLKNWPWKLKRSPFHAWRITSSASAKRAWLSLYGMPSASYARGEPLRPMPKSKRPWVR